MVLSIDWNAETGCCRELLPPMADRLLPFVWKEGPPFVDSGDETVETMALSVSIKDKGNR